MKLFDSWRVELSNACLIFVQEFFFHVLSAFRASPHSGCTITLIFNWCLCRQSFNSPKYLYASDHSNCGIVSLYKMKFSSVIFFLILHKIASTNPIPLDAESYSCLFCKFTSDFGNYPNILLRMFYSDSSSI